MTQSLPPLDDVHYCPACQGTLDGTIQQDGVCDGCGHRAFEPITPTGVSA